MPTLIVSKSIYNQDLNTYHHSDKLHKHRNNRYKRTIRSGYSTDANGVLNSVTENEINQILKVGTKFIDVTDHPEPNPKYPYEKQSDFGLIF